MAGPIRISILANAGQANRAIASVSAEANGMGVRVGKAGRAMGLAVAAGGALAGAAALKFGAASVKSASDAQQSLGATETVFGKYASTVIKRSNEAAKAIGLSANEYRELSNVTGALLSGSGMPLRKTAQLTDQLNKRAADMAATFGGTTREAVEAISSLMKGEADPIERYGVSIKQSDVSARLAAKGLSGLTGEGLKQAEMQARLELLTSKTAKTQGAFAREGNTLAHQQQVLGAQWENLKATVGAALLPVLTRLLTTVNDNLVPAFEAASGFVSPLVDRIRALGSGAGASNGPLSAMASFFTGSLIPAVQSVITAYQNFYAAFIPIIQQVAAAIQAKWGQIGPQVQAIWSSVQTIITSALSIVQSVVRIATGVVLAVWSRFGATLTRFAANSVGNLVTVLRGAFQVVEGIFKTVSAVLKGDWRGAWEGIKTILRGALNVVKGALSQGLNMLRSLASIGFGALKGIAKAALSAMAGAVRAGIGSVVGALGGLPGRVKGALSGALGWLTQAGRDVIQGLINGITEAGQWVQSKIEAIADKIPGWLKKRLGIASPSKVMRALARFIPMGVAVGILDGAAGVEKATKAVGDRVQAVLDQQFTKRERSIRKRLDGKAETRALARAKAAYEKHSKAVAKSLRDENAALAKNGRLQDAVAAKLANANQALADAKKTRDDYAASIRDTIVGSGALTTFGEGQGFGSVAQLIAQRQAAVAEAQKFSSVIQSLAKAGLNAADVQDLLSKGVGALGTAEAILGGGSSAIQSMNSLQSQLAATGTNLGKVMGDKYYGAGVSAAQGIVNGLNAQAKQLDKAAIRLANNLVKAVKKALGIRSPSRRFRDEISKNVVRGIDFRPYETYVQRQGARLANNVVKGYGTPALDAYASTRNGGSGGQSQVIEVRLTAEQASDLQEGKRLMGKIDVARGAGVKWAAV